jgi:hypothetical protein
MWFQFICGILFICVISGSPGNCSFTTDGTDVRGLTQILFPFICDPVHPRNLRFPWQLFFLPQKTPACRRQAETAV